MNTYLLGLITKWMTLLISVSGLNSAQLFSEEKIEVDNINQTKNTTAEVKTIDYKTQTNYNSKLPKDTVVTKVKGKEGLAYTSNGESTVQAPITEVIEVGTGDYGNYTGKMTGYGADCDGCTGDVYCPVNNKTWNLTNDGINYTDSEYGEVRILAASLDKFPCGTIIEVQNPNIGTFNAIVLDTGSDMRKAWTNGIVHMDLAFYKESSDGLHDVTSDNTKYNVKRWGW